MTIDFAIVMQQMMIFVLIIAVAFLLRKMKIFNEDTSVHITKIVLKLTLPAFLISSVLGVRELEIPRSQTPIFFAIIILSFIITGIICAIFAVLCVKKQTNQRGAYVMMGLVGNVNFMGLPFVYAFMGADAMVFATMYSLIFTLTTFTVGMKLIGGKEAKVSAKLIFSPITVAAMIAVLIFVVDFRLPTSAVYDTYGNLVSEAEAFYRVGAVLREVFLRLGRVTSPMAMVILGSTLAGMKFKEMFQGWRTYAISIVRVAVVPVVLFFALLPFATTQYLEMLLQVIIIINATAMAVSIVIIAANYHRNEKIIGQGIFVSHLISLVTLPFLLTWLFGFLPGHANQTPNYSEPPAVYVQEYVLDVEGRVAIDAVVVRSGDGNVATDAPLFSRTTVDEADPNEKFWVDGAAEFVFAGSENRYLVTPASADDLTVGTRVTVYQSADQFTLDTLPPGLADAIVVIENS